MTETGSPQLIITGDDFGSSTSANQAVLKAHREGVLTHASLMVNENAADDAIRIAKSTPGLSVGLHLVLVLGQSTLPRDSIPHISDRSGEFSKSPFKAGMHYYFSPVARNEVRREMRAQFERFKKSGLPFSHVDGHNHLHLHPVIFDELLTLCHEFGVNRIRMVTSEGSSLVGRVFDQLTRSGIQKAAQSGLNLPRIRVYGLEATGKINEAYLVELINSLEPVDSEIYVHPLGPEATRSELASNPNGPKELEALLSPRVRNIIQAKGFRLAASPVAASQK